MVNLSLIDLIICLIIDKTVFIRIKNAINLFK